MTKSSIVVRAFNEHQIQFQSDGWFNATEAAAKFGRRVDVWLKTDETKAYISALCEMSNTQKSDYIKTKKGNGGCTLIHPKLMLSFAIWLDCKALVLAAEKISSVYEIIKALNDFEVPSDCPDLYVYAIRNVTTGNIKLGISRDPQERLKQLQTGSDCALQLVAYRKAENRFEDEVSIHRHVSPYHIRGEWFDEGVNKMLIEHGLAESENKIPEQNPVMLLFSEWISSHNKEAQ